MSTHYPVLLSEVINGLNVQDDSVIVDLTLGRAGHSSALLLKARKGYLYGFDQDETAIKESREVLSKTFQNFTLFHQNFKDFDLALNALGVKGADIILLDLGVSSPQFDVSERGFSYRYDGPLDMRMDRTNNNLTAAIIVNTYTEARLKEIFYNYAESRYSARIAREIIDARKAKPIATTLELVEIIKRALPSKELRKKGHPAKTIFQALRIEVNNELGVLSEVLARAPHFLNEGGRLAVISFHSLEDRLVKNTFKRLASLSDEARHPYSLPDKNKVAPFTLVNRKVIVASDDEIELNPRASSAKLRIIEKRRTKYA
ncbi:MAG: Ribosomal RNA small subunit methyltransferase H [Tenericutes bacterium ADurb.Bin087]|nr:MAG: Ribosomal RNA small subunit methyltransferase H [Tenericutes bacterium ADurb.Bin087]